MFFKRFLAGATPFPSILKNPVTSAAPQEPSLMPRGRRRRARLSAFVRDRLLLLASAFAVAAILFVYFMLSQRLGVSGDGQFLLLQTLGLTVFASSVRRFSPWRRRRLRLKWPLAVASGGLLFLHLATVGAFVILYHPSWRAPHWEIVTDLELAVFSIVLCWVDEYCTLEHRPPFTAFLAEQLRVATGHIDSGEPKQH